MILYVLKFEVKINFWLNSNKQGGNFDICYFKEKRFIRLMKRPRSTYYDCNRKPRSAKENPYTYVRPEKEAFEIFIQKFLSYNLKRI